MRLDPSVVMPGQADAGLALNSTQHQGPARDTTSMLHSLANRWIRIGLALAVLGWGKRSINPVVPFD